MVVDQEHHLEPREIWEKRGGKPGQLVVQHAPDGTPLRPLDDATHDIAIHLKNMDIGKGKRTYIEKIRRMDLGKKSIDAMLGANAIDPLGLEV